MKRLTTTVICIAGVLATTVIAQESQTQPGQRQPGISSSRDTTTYSATGRGMQVRASKVIGAEVKSSTSEELGKIEDVIFNPQSGRVEFAVINWENKLVPIPFRLLSSTGDATAATPTAGMDRLTFTAQVDKDKLQNAPTISDRSRWSELQQGTFSQRVYSHYGVQSEGVGAPGLDSERGGGREGSRTPGQPQSTPGTSPRTSPN
jgi:sporulation protein YlmC with PRC-barrel domain